MSLIISKFVISRFHCTKISILGGIVLDISERVPEINLFFLRVIFPFTSNSDFLFCMLKVKMDLDIKFVDALKCQESH